MDLQQQVQGMGVKKRKNLLQVITKFILRSQEWMVAGGPTAAGARDGGPAGFSGSFLAGQ